MRGRSASSAGSAASAAIQAVRAAKTPGHAPSAFMPEAIDPVPAASAINLMPVLANLARRTAGNQRACGLASWRARADSTASRHQATAQKASSSPTPMTRGSPRITFGLLADQSNMT